MDEKDGLILGIDLQEETAQVCFYNDKLNIPQAAPGENGSVVIPNHKRLSQCMTEYDEESHFEDLLSMIAILIEYGKKSVGRMRISQICICLDPFIADLLEMVDRVMDRLQYSKEQYEIISRPEAFAYYAYSQKKELYSAGTVLLDLNQNGLTAYRMSSFRKNGMDFIHEDREDFQSDSLRSAGKKEAGIEEVCEELCTDIEELMKGKTASTMYLTGKGFDYDKLPEKLTKTICNRRKAFLGQNLYVKGACYCARERQFPKVFDNLILDCENRIQYGIETDIVERGQKRRLRIVRPGMNWFESERKLDFILEDERMLTFILTDANGVVREEKLDISDIPFRSGKTTRICVHVQYTATDRCMITVKDKGFGQFVKSSGKVFYLEINFT